VKAPESNAGLTRQCRFDQVHSKKGPIVPVLVHSSPLNDDKRKPIGTMAFVTDMTEHKKALALAGEVQKSLLPRNQPGIQGFDIAGKNRYLFIFLFNLW
jgi:sigma-B regulation protein RsbU (phosphoserine phosphatase)